ncbi:hypothetical protein ACUUL3_16780 [Thiovibrio sp. JS02]
MREFVVLADLKGQVRSREGLARHILARGGLTVEERRQLEVWRQEEQEKANIAAAEQEQAARRADAEGAKKTQIEQAWATFKALPESTQAQIMEAFRAGLSPEFRRDFSLERPSVLYSLRAWLPEKLKEYLQ